MPFPIPLYAKEGLGAGWCMLGDSSGPLFPPPPPSSAKVTGWNQAALRYVTYFRVSPPVR